MNLYKDRYTLASLVGFVILLLFGGLWHTMLFTDFYHHQLVPIVRSRSLVSFVLLAELGKACALAYIYPYLALEENSTVMGAAGKLSVLAAVLGFCLWVCTAYGVLGIPGIQWFWMETIFVMIQGVAAGFGISLTYDYKRLRESASKPVIQS